MPKISVVMPVYNTKEEYLREAIESVLTQTFTDFEFLIVDNGSKSHIKDIISSYDDKRIKYFRLEKNQGPAYARNYGIKNAQGTYIAFIDSDDVALKDRFKLQIEYFNKNPNVGCLGTAVVGIGKEAEKVKFNIFKSNFEIEMYLIFNGCTFCQSSVMLRKSILDNNNIRYKNEYFPAEDYGLWLDLIGYTQFAVLPEVLTQYRFYPENTSHQQKELQKEKTGLVQFKAFEKYCGVKFANRDAWIKFMTGIPLYPEELTEIENNLMQIIDTLVQKGCIRKDLLYFFKRKFKKSYYRTKTIKGQWRLYCSSLNDFFKLSLRWRFMCLITRGLF